MDDGAAGLRPVEGRGASPVAVPVGTPRIYSSLLFTAHVQFSGRFKRPKGVAVAGTAVCPEHTRINYHAEETSNNNSISMLTAKALLVG